MTANTITRHHDADLSVPGHTAIRTYNHNTRAVGINCLECEQHLGLFAPDRWREKRISETWAEHLAPAPAAVSVDAGHPANPDTRDRTEDDR